MFTSVERHHLLLVSSLNLLHSFSHFLPTPLPPPAFSFWRRSWRGGAASAVFFLRTVLLMQNTDGYYGAAHKLIMLEINCCCQRQPPTCPSVSLCPLMHRIQLMGQMFAQCAALFKVSTKVVKGLSDFLRHCTFSRCPLAFWSFDDEIHDPEHDTDNEGFVLATEFYFISHQLFFGRNAFCLADDNWVFSGIPHKPLICNKASESLTIVPKDHVVSSAQPACQESTNVIPK